VTRNVFAAACLACLFVGYLVASAPGFNPLNPFRPSRDRPVVRFLARIAKLGLWMTVLADPPPQSIRREYRDGDGVCHMEGW
jgi:hypothetical protein